MAADLIAREGIEAATIRRLAAMSGASTAVITHYFADKRDILLSAYTALSEEYSEKFEAARAADPADLTGCLMAMAAADEVSFARWKTYVAFWDCATRDEAWARRVADDLEVALQKIRSVIEVRNPGRDDAEDCGLALNAFVQGLSAQAIMSPETWPRDRLRRAIERVVQQTLGPAAL